MPTNNNNNNNTKRSSFPSFKEVYNLWKESDHMDPEADLELITNYLIKYKFSLDIAKDLAYNLIESFKKKTVEVDNTEGDEPLIENIPLEDRGIFLSKLDISFITDTVKSMKPFPLNKGEFQLISLLISFMAYARTHPHPKKWIRCGDKDKQKIYLLAGFPKNMPTKEKLGLTTCMHTLYGMNMRVIGSTQPTPCYLFDWQDETEFDTLIKIGEAHDVFAIKNFLNNIIDNLKE